MRAESHNGVRIVRFRIEHLLIGWLAFPLFRRAMIALSDVPIVPPALPRAAG